MLWSGRARVQDLPQMAVVAGALVLPTLWGSKVYVGMSAAAFRRGVLWLLIFAGTLMLAAGLKSLLH
jgi:hypothetical protein